MVIYQPSSKSFFIWQLSVCRLLPDRLGQIEEDLMLLGDGEFDILDDKMVDIGLFSW